MAEITLENVQAALAAVEDPTFEATLAKLGTLDEVKLEGQKVSARVRVSSPTESVREEIRRRVEKALETLGMTQVSLEFDIQIPTRETTSNDPIPTVRNVILVMSGKGGVGKSTVAANLALALARSGTRVGLLDADVYGPSVPTMLGIQGHPSSKDGKRIEPLQRFGVKLMSIGFLLEDPKQAVIWRGAMLHGALQQFISDVNWGELDYLVLDLPPGTGDVALTLAQNLKVTGALMVTTPQEVALIDVHKALSMCKKLDIPVLGIVENMSYFVDPSGTRHALFGEGGGAKLAEEWKTPVLAQIPIDPAVGRAGDAGTPVVQADPTCASAKVFTAMAENLTERIARMHRERAGGEEAPVTAGPKRLRIVQ
ncbi:MAG: Mrp/NBP35 family ATP-binding protein [Deltaproteobacteria bacterium]|nr:Mrp/NBP35 family ATP-binding protein [Deltaproteobacteria bacterium]